MIMTVKDLIKLKEIQDKEIKSLWCETQQDDIQEIIDLMEEVSSSAMNCCSPSGNAMGQDILKYAKNKFIDTLLRQSEHYRYVSSKTA